MMSNLYIESEICETSENPRHSDHLTNVDSDQRCSMAQWLA